MTPDYCSFLICVHKERTCVYVNGLEIGIIENGIFKPTSLNVHGNLIPKTFRNLHVPFKNMEEFKQTLHDAVDKINIQNDVETP